MCVNLIDTSLGFEVGLFAFVAETERKMFRSLNSPISRPTHVCPMKTSLLLLCYVAPQPPRRRRRLAAGIREALVEVKDVAGVAEVDAGHLVPARARRRRLAAALVVGQEVRGLLVLVAL